MAWGKSLFKYDPDSDSVQTYPLPAFSSLGVSTHLYQDGTDGNIVAMTIDAGGEVWVAAYKVAGVFGFNPHTRSWDRTVHLPWFPYEDTRLTSPEIGVLMLNGFRSPDNGKTVRYVFAKVQISTGKLTPLLPGVVDYGLLTSEEAIYYDEAGNLGRVNLTDGKATVMVVRAPVGGHIGAYFTPDGKGHLWFSLLAYRQIGVAELDLSTFSLIRFNFPYVVDPGGPGPPDTCPSGAPTCIPDNAVMDPQVAAIVLDRRANLWVVTGLPGSRLPGQGDPVEIGGMAPVMELAIPS
jgi:hypothetical protein